jgi:hypothetical protein
MSKQKKQKTKYFGLYEDEIHPEGYNWNGPFTQNMERMSLNYKGKVGTKSFYLPANELDYAAFVHDLQYFSPSPIARMFADKQYFEKNIKGSKRPSAQLSRAFIYGAWAGRIGKEIGKLGVTGFKLKEAIPSLLKILRSKYIYPFGIQPDARRRVNPDAPRMIPEFHLSDILDILYTNFGIDIREDRSTIKEFVKMLLPSLFLGSEIVPKPIQEIKKVYKAVMDDYEESKEYKILDKETDKVKDSYKKYLDTVGSFNKDGDFVIKDNINENEAKRAYIDYYKQSKKYFEWLNEYYKDYRGFKDYVKATYPKDSEWEFPKLNPKELDKVANPVMKKAPPITLPPNFKFEVLDPFPREPEIEPEIEEDDEDIIVGFEDEETQRDIEEEGFTISNEEEEWSLEII